MASYLLTDLTGDEDSGADKKTAVAEATAWLAAQPGPVPHVVPVLKERFGLNNLQACQAIALARSAPATTSKQEGEQ